MSITQRDNNRNQSAVDISHLRIFLFNNTYQSAVFNNNTGAPFTLQPGMLVVRNTANAAQVLPPADVDALANVIGIVAIDEEVELAIAGTLNINYATQGDVDETKLILPAGTLDSVPLGSGKTVRDILNSLGFHLTPTTENTKFDN